MIDKEATSEAAGRFVQHAVDATPPPPARFITCLDFIPSRRTFVATSNLDLNILRPSRPLPPG